MKVIKLKEQDIERLVKKIIKEDWEVDSDMWLVSGLEKMGFGDGKEEVMAAFNYLEKEGELKSLLDAMGSFDNLNDKHIKAITNEVNKRLGEH
jgi:hypothetical protein